MKLPEHLEKKRDELSLLELGDHCYPFDRGFNDCYAEMQATHAMDQLKLNGHLKLAKDMQEREKKLVEALKFYANPDNHGRQPLCGQLAADALKELGI